MGKGKGGKGREEEERGPAPPQKKIRLKTALLMIYKPNLVFQHCKLSKELVNFYVRTSAVTAIDILLFCAVVSMLSGFVM